MPRTLRFKYILHGEIFNGEYMQSYRLDMQGKQPYVNEHSVHVNPPIEIEAGNLKEMYDIFFKKYGLILKKRTQIHWYGYTPEELSKNKKMHCASFEILRR